MQQFFRFFWFSGVATAAILLAVLVGMGWAAAAIAVLLVLIEVTFSFENAVINAKTLQTMSRRWQTLFLTAGIVIAIFGMRVVFPVLIVALTAHLPWHQVVDLALHHPAAYARQLEHAHPAIAAFGGAFLLVLCLRFFFDNEREVRWIEHVERPLQRLEHRWSPAVAVASLMAVLAALPANQHAQETLRAGLLGVVVYMAMQGLTYSFDRLQRRRGTTGGSALQQTGWAALMTFVYLEILDASFSFDGVIGAFAVTNSVILIAAGLGIGAVWVRSLTVFMVRQKTLRTYRYLEHGAHYTVVILATTLLLSIFVPVPEFVAGISGVIFVSAALISSQRALRAAAASGKLRH